MRRGDVYEYTIGSARARVVIISDEIFAPDKAMYVKVVDPSGQLSSPVTVTTTITFPVRGTIDATTARRVDPSALGQRFGRLTPETQRALDGNLRTYLGL